MKKLVVLGGGYGGITIIQKLLAHELPNDRQIILIDRMPYHGLKTEYFALAAGTEKEHHITIPFPQDTRLTIHYGEITQIDLNNRLVHLANEEPIAYDECIIGLGCVDNYHNIRGAREHSHSIQTLAATRRTYLAINDVKPHGQITIVGGGLSGVELASELREARTDLNIRIMDHGKSVLAPFAERLRNYVEDWFKHHDVEIIHQAHITEVTLDGVIHHGDVYMSDTVVWTAGIRANQILETLDVPKDRIGRLQVSPHHHLVNYPEVFVVGDCADLPYAPTAQLAEAQGAQIAEIIYRRWKGTELKPLPKIKLKGTLGSLGSKEGFGEMGATSIVGRIPRLLKSGILWMHRHHSG